MSTAAKPATIIGQAGHFHSAFDRQGHWFFEDSLFMPVEGVVTDTSIEEWSWTGEGSYLRIELTNEAGLYFNELSDLHFGPSATCPQSRPAED